MIRNLYIIYSLVLLLYWFQDVIANDAIKLDWDFKLSFLTDLVKVRHKEALYVARKYYATSTACMDPLVPVSGLVSSQLHLHCSNVMQRSDPRTENKDGLRWLRLRLS